eukprot:TRINITY_DN10711_c0_g1_i1.p1 TRINITY_DN10711_c0_g1~~TRINITY_DN10711_c0_g1_i1.p1  ORF type:complete len:204 (-),score=20.03 TRINITY_DN10711_c0_g1_i1:31-642(-)
MKPPRCSCCTSYAVVLIHLILASISLAPSEAATTDLPILEPDAALEFQKIRWGDTKYYFIQNLAPSSHYEVRISYPAYYPTQFDIEIIPSGRASTGRDTLNVEKNMFRTDANGHIMGIPLANSADSYLVKVSAVYDGYSNRKGYDDREVEFNIVLETLFYGAPYGVLKLGALMIALIGAALAALKFTNLARLCGFEQDLNKQD